MSTTPVAPFDAAAYKRGTREQWQSAAAAWHRWGPHLEAWLGGPTEVMLDLAGVTAGSKVLDVAAGGGGQTMAAARRVGPSGGVLATDISPAILEYAASEVKRAGLSNVSTREMDGEQLEVEPDAYDAVISRVGLIYFPDQQAALTGMRRALKKGGKVAAIVYSTPDRNRFFSVPVSIIRRRANLPPPLPGQPGPFSLGSPDALQHAYEAAGFHDVEVRVIEAPLLMVSAAEFTRFARESFGALHQMLSGLGAAEREEAWTEIATAMREFEGPSGFAGPCELIVGAATK
jgi:ubiquinone/menaquinone biosynthesis C-methylase UbiE